jgi:hypothetical protein
MASVSKVVDDLLDRARKADPLVLAGAGVVALGLTYGVARIVFGPKDGPAAMNDDQLAFADPITVDVDGKAIRVHRVSPSGSGVAAASAILAAGNKADPLMVACGAEVSAGSSGHSVSGAARAVRAHRRVRRS